MRGHLLWIACVGWCLRSPEHQTSETPPNARLHQPNRDASKRGCPHHGPRGLGGTHFERRQTPPTKSKAKTYKNTACLWWKAGTSGCIDRGRAKIETRGAPPTTPSKNRTLAPGSIEPGECTQLYEVQRCQMVSSILDWWQARVRERIISRA